MLQNIEKLYIIRIMENSIGKKKVKKAFTIAETLSAIATIGIIAAIIIPSSIQNIGRRKAEHRIKMTYSILGNLISQSEVYNNVVLTWDFDATRDNPNQNSAARAFSEEYMTPYMNLMYICGSKDSDKKCFNKKNNEIYASNGEAFNSPFNASNAYMFRLKNGISFAVIKSKAIKSCMKDTVYIAVDIDGPDKGNSIAGRDVFMYKISRSRGLEAFYCEDKENGICEESCTGGPGTEWAYKFTQNNFKSPKDYKVTDFARTPKNS